MHASFCVRIRVKWSCSCMCISLSAGTHMHRRGEQEAEERKREREREDSLLSLIAILWPFTGASIERKLLLFPLSTRPVILSFSVSQCTSERRVEENNATRRVEWTVLSLSLVLLPFVSTLLASLVCSLSLSFLLCEHSFFSSALALYEMINTMWNCHRVIHGHSSSTFFAGPLTQGYTILFSPL